MKLASTAEGETGVQSAWTAVVSRPARYGSARLGAVRCGAVRLGAVRCGAVAGAFVARKSGNAVSSVWQ